MVWFVCSPVFLFFSRVSNCTAQLLAAMEARKKLFDSICRQMNISLAHDLKEIDHLKAQVFRSTCSEAEGKASKSPEMESQVYIEIENKCIIHPASELMESAHNPKGLFD